MTDILIGSDEDPFDRFRILKEILKAQAARWDNASDAVPNQEIVELQEVEPNMKARARTAFREAKAKFGEAADRAFTLVLAMTLLEGGKAILRMVV